MHRPEFGRRIGLTAIALMMLAPSVASASGDPRLIWWLIGGAATHTAVGGVLLLFAITGRLRAGWLVAFAAAAAVVWYLYLGLDDVGPVANIGCMILAPLAWLFLLRRR